MKRKSVGFGICILALATIFSSQMGAWEVATQSEAESTSVPCLLGASAVVNQPIRQSGSLRSGNHSVAQVIADIQHAATEACEQFSADALRKVMLKVSDDYIILSGTVPSDSDEEQLISIAVTSADGRTVFNRLSIEASTSNLRTPIE